MNFKEMLEMLADLMEFSLVTDALKNIYFTIPPQEVLERALGTLDRDMGKLKEEHRFLFGDIRSIIVAAMKYNEAYDEARSHIKDVDALRAELDGGAPKDYGLDLSGFDEWFKASPGGKNDSSH